MLRVWNVCLVITTFFLTIFGTFMTRSGVVQSVHAFGDDPELARLFTIFMITTVVVSFGFVIYRLPLLRARNELDSWLSREAAFLFNNWILLFSAFFVLFATMFPTLSEAVRGERLTVGPPFFNQWMLPIGLTLMLLTGIGPLLAWRKSTVSNLRDSFLFPVSMGLIAAVVVVSLGVRVWASGICFALTAFVVGTISQEFWRGARVRQRGTGTDVFTALVGLVGRNKRRYGGYIVHLAMMLIFFGFAGEGFKQKEEAQLKPGQQVAVGDFVVRHDALSVTDDGQKQMITAHLTVLRDGKPFAEMYPAKWIFRKHEESPTTEVAINRGLAQDVYVVLATFDAATQTASLAIDINPLVNWVWMGFGLLALGVGIALLPDAAFAFATAAIPANAATTALILLAVALSQGVVLAQDTIPAIFRSPLERQVASEIMCNCGGCRLSVADCGMMNCHGKSGQLSKIHQYMAAGQDHDAILATFVREHGGYDVLMEPPNRGFNRIAWLLPYVVAGTALLGLAATARRWSRREVAAPAAAAIDPELDARLQDELRDLD
jgi:cytochrome c-type biogenesis protein CcmF